MQGVQVANLNKLWAIASLSIDGVNEMATIDSHKGLEGLSVVYVNNVCNIIGLKPMFEGHVNEDGSYTGKPTSNFEESSFLLFMRHFATKGSVLDGKLDMSEVTDEWLASLPYLVENGKLDITSADDNFILSMIATQLNFGEFEPDASLLSLGSKNDNNDMAVKP